jgi:RNA polymerase sigma-70 factor (ECF subfamily)
MTLCIIFALAAPRLSHGRAQRQYQEMTSAMPSLPLSVPMGPLVATHHAFSAEPRSDEQLLTAYAVANDRPALEILLTRHLARSWRVARRLGGSDFEADEAVQRSWIAVMRHAHRYQRRPQGSVGAWILGIVLRCERQRAREERRRSRWHALAAHRAVPAPIHIPGDTADDGAGDLADETARALATLAERYRLPVTLRYLEGMDYPHLAQVLGIPERTARTRVARGLHRLRHQLAAATPHSDEQLLRAVAPLALAMAPTLPQRLAESCTLPVAPIGGMALASMALIGALVAVPLTMAVVAVIGGWRWHAASTRNSPLPSVAGVAAAAYAPAQAPLTLEARQDRGDDSLASLLATPVSCQIYHAWDLQALQARLPDGLHLPLAWPVHDGDGVPWSGTTLVFHQTPLHLILDQACHDLGMRYQARHGRLLVSMVTPPALAEVVAHGLPRQGPAFPVESLPRYRLALAACRSLVLAHSTPALRAVLLMLTDADAQVARAAHDALAAYLGTPWPTHLVGNAYLALRDDPDVAASIQRAEPISPPDADSAGTLAWHGDPYLIYLRGLWPDADTVTHQLAMLQSIPALTHLQPGREQQEPWELWSVQLMSAASADQPDPQVVAALRQQLRTQPLMLPRLFSVAMAYVSARLGDAEGVNRIRAAWAAFAPSGGPDLGHDDDDGASVLVDATVEAALQCPRSQELLGFLVDLCGSTETSEARSAAAATALVRIRDPRTTRLILDAVRAHVQKPVHLQGVLMDTRGRTLTTPCLPPAMSVLIGMGLRSQLPLLTACDAETLTPELHVLIHAAERACDDPQAAAMLQADGEDGLRRSAADLMACQDGFDAAIAIVVRQSREQPDDGTLLTLLGMSKHPLAIGALVERLSQSGRSATEIPEILEGLATSGDAQASQTLERGLLAHAPWSAYALQALVNAQWPLLSDVVRAASTAANPRPDRSSIDHLQDPDDALSCLTAAAPGSANRSILVQALENALLDEPWHGSEQADEVLAALVRSDPDAEVREAALLALKDLSDPLDDPAVVRVFAAAATDANATVRGQARLCLDHVRGCLRSPPMRLTFLGAPTHEKQVQVLSTVLAEPPAAAHTTPSQPPRAGF